jgi:flagellar basal body L-ring protein FlgH
MDCMDFGRGLVVALALAAAPQAAAAPDAAALLAEAEKAVAEARARQALWTTAQEALLKARRALDAGDTATAIEQARFARDQAALGIAQTRYPPTR